MEVNLLLLGEYAGSWMGKEIMEIELWDIEGTWIIECISLAEIKYYFNLSRVPFKAMAVISYIHNTFIHDSWYGFRDAYGQSKIPSKLCNIHRIYTVHLEGI